MGSVLDLPASAELDAADRPDSEHEHAGAGQGESGCDHEGPVKLAGTVFSFRFYINAKPYAFEGKIDGGRLEGKYNGAEAAGTLRCSR